MTTPSPTSDAAGLLRAADVCFQQSCALGDVDLKTNDFARGWVGACHDLSVFLRALSTTPPARSDRPPDPDLRKIAADKAGCSGHTCGRSDGIICPNDECDMESGLYVERSEAAPNTVEQAIREDERATGRREAFDEACANADYYAGVYERAGLAHPENSDYRDRCLARSRALKEHANTIRARSTATNTTSPLGASPDQPQAAPDAKLVEIPGLGGWGICPPIEGIIDLWHVTDPDGGACALFSEDEDGRAMYAAVLAEPQPRDERVTERCPGCDGSGHDSSDPKWQCPQCAGTGRLFSERRSACLNEWAPLKHRQVCDCSECKAKDARDKDGRIRELEADVEQWKRPIHEWKTLAIKNEDHAITAEAKLAEAQKTIADLRAGLEPLAKRAEPWVKWIAEYSVNDWEIDRKESPVPVKVLLNARSLLDATAKGEGA